MKKIILLGPPGAGKGTQADLICEVLEIPKISTGDMLRAAIASQSSLGKKVENILSSGALVSDDVIIELINDRLLADDCAIGYLFDGVPRTVGQAELFDQSNIGIDGVIQIDLPDDVIVERMSGRRFHIQSGRSYHINFNPPKQEGIDDVTGEPLIQREDDLPDTVLKRLQVYHDQTHPLIDFYTAKANQQNLEYISVDGNQTVDKVFADIKAIL